MTRTCLQNCCLTLLLLSLGSAAAFGFDTEYWAWQRNEPASAQELAELEAQGVRAIHWQIGELVQSGADWRWRARFDLPPNVAGLRFVPVVRLESQERNPFTAQANESLFSALTAATRGADELQIDYDAPDRLLRDYAATLRQLHKLVPRVTITALPHWAHSSGAGEFRGAADELLVMLYDFEPDPKGGPPLPLIVPDKIDRYLSEWNEVQIPWRVGLPVFARMTVFDPDGKSRGHVRNWNWDDVCFSSALEVVAPTNLGVTTLRAKRDTRVDNAVVRAGQLVTARLPDRAALSRAVSAAQKTNARGVVYFRFPDSTDPSGWSLRQLGHLDAAPQLSVHVNPETSQIELLNNSDADLVFSATAGERGYVLQIEAPAPVFRDAGEGEFWRVTGEADGRAAPIQLATRLTFWFSHLRARQALRTGPIRLAPAANFSQAQWRILNFASQSQWQQVTP
ncbi:MAG TPA: DUF3142 domain-containing protein [Chthoniobacterales bacterium]|nr:DUF3142 domain-containing protein [Chthoniobacterales bacterium]